MHNGHLRIEGEKMSKSFGNFYTVHDLLKEFPGEAIRLALLKTHYRQPMDFTKEGIREAKADLDKFYSALRPIAQTPFIDGQETGMFDGRDGPPVIVCLEDDLNTPRAISYLHSIVGDLNRTESNAKKALYKKMLLEQASLLGLLQEDPEIWFKGAGEEGLDEAAINNFISKRIQARADKDFAESDRIRDELAEQGVVLEDRAGGTTWRRE
jgi:cysteinyl-tRNA synthetase